jgi:hypothetical protein
MASLNAVGFEKYFRILKIPSQSAYFVSTLNFLPYREKRLHLLSVSLTINEAGVLVE